MSREDGSTSLAVLASISVVMTLMLGLVDLGAVLIAKARAQTAADAAALAAAAELIPAPRRDPVGQARRFASANGARLVSCICDVSDSRVEVVVASPVKLVLLAPVLGGSVRSAAAADIQMGVLRGSARSD